MSAAKEQEGIWLLLANSALTVSAAVIAATGAPAINNTSADAIEAPAAPKHPSGAGGEGTDAAGRNSDEGFESCS